MAESGPPQPGQQKPAREQGQVVPISERNKRIQAIIESFYETLGEEQLEQFLEEFTARVKYLRGKYPDHDQRTILHAVSFSGSYPSDGVTIEDDFPGDDSVEKFVNHLAQKYGQ